MAKKISAADGIIYNWQPFDDVSLNYPLGSHFLVVVIGKISGLPLHRVFQLLIPLTGIITTAEVYCFSFRLFATENVAIYSALAYGIWAVYGSIDYYRWGGLPNALGMAFLLAILNLAVQDQQNWKHRALTALLFTGICLTHHHVMITGGVLLLVLCFWFWRSQDSPRAWTLLLGLFGAVLLGGFYIVPYAWKAGSIGETNVFRFYESGLTIFSLVRSVGVILAPTSFAGLVLCIRLKKKDAFALKLLCVISLTLIVLYLLCDPVYRVVSVWISGHDYVAFTPSRFLTDLVYFLSIFAGYATYEMSRRYRFSVGATVFLCLVLGLANYPTWKQLFLADPLPEGKWLAYQWIEKNTPTNTIVTTTDAWASYASWRRNLSSPLPISEPRSHIPPDSVAQHGRTGKFADEEPSFPLVTVASPGEVVHGGKVLWIDGHGWSVVSIGAWTNVGTSTRSRNPSPASTSVR